MCCPVWVRQKGVRLLEASFALFPRKGNSSARFKRAMAYSGKRISVGGLMKSEREGEKNLIERKRARRRTAAKANKNEINLFCLISEDLPLLINRPACESTTFIQRTFAQEFGRLTAKNSIARNIGDSGGMILPKDIKTEFLSVFLL